MKTNICSNKFGTRLRNARDSREITFETAATVSNIDKCRLLDIELNYVVPDAEEVLCLCRIYHIGVERIIREG